VEDRDWALSQDRRTPRHLRSLNALTPVQVAGVSCISGSHTHHHLVTCEEAFRTLRIRQFNNPELLRRAYLRRARETHPDHGGSAEEFRKVWEAHEVLLRHCGGIDTTDSAEKPLPLARTSIWWKKHHWYLLTPTLYAYLVAPHMGWARLPAALCTINDALRSTEWVLAIAYLLAIRDRSSR
jgi:hypothetical protein